MSDKKARVAKTVKAPTMTQRLELQRKELLRLYERNKLLAETNSDLIQIAKEMESIKEQLTISREMTREAREGYAKFREDAIKYKYEAEQFKRLKNNLETLLFFARHHNDPAEHEMKQYSAMHVLTFLYNVSEGEVH